VAGIEGGNFWLQQFIRRPGSSASFWPMSFELLASISFCVSVGEGKSR
jgi:hypothetical protein